MIFLERLVMASFISSMNIYRYEYERKIYKALKTRASRACTLEEKYRSSLVSSFSLFLHGQIHIERELS
ncbi:hypothetical protein HOLleu_03642 [Holothuria leucospilota]|uniref:Uncharacterized protein n=1 Tax=Holothuria leucospilota TaxID=206669 RepID=A0A9Q1CRW1_HOLLE|nr:hypothetical protein HOLleu_03642 [Holothuria leucospilota]